MSSRKEPRGAGDNALASPELPEPAAVSADDRDLRMLGVLLG